MIAAIPSPSLKEELRAQFVLDRLALLNVEKSIDTYGNILVRLYSAKHASAGPLLFFTDLGTSRWHSVHSLSQLDATTARGAGLADVLGTASLLSLIEGIITGRIINNTDVMFLFSAHSFDDPKIDAFEYIVNNHNTHPSAALGVQGFSLGSIVTSLEGNYQLEIKAVSPILADENEDPEKKKPVLQPDNLVIDALVEISRNLSSLTWDDDDTTHCYIRRIEGGTGFGAIPSEGVLDIEIDSGDANLLESALKLVESIVEKIRGESDLTFEIKVVSHIPAGVSSINDELTKQIVEIMKDLHIKVKEKSGSDPAAFLINNGIPSLSLGVSKGRVGLEHDVINIDSVEKGRQLLEQITGKLFKEKT